MFKTYMLKYYPENYDVKKVAYELASLYDNRFAVFADGAGQYYVWDGFKWFNVNNVEYDEPNVDLEVDTAFVPVQSKPMKAISMRRFAVSIGSRKVAPIYNFETGAINMIGVAFEDLGGIITINDTGKVRAFSYGIRGSEFYFEEL